MDGKQIGEGGEGTTTPKQHCTGGPSRKRGPALLELKLSMLTDAFIHQYNYGMWAFQSYICPHPA